jgi:hypothetical protein
MFEIDLSDFHVGFEAGVLSAPSFTALMARLSLVLLFIQLRSFLPGREQ